MERETRILWTVVAGVVAAAVLIGLFGKARQELVPEPRAAWVAIAVGDDPVAASGPVELAAGEPFTLHAVLEAESWRGERVFYTEAAGLRLGGEEIPVSALRRWTGGEELRILWFTVEGAPPFLEVARAGDLERLQFREAFRADWPQAWAVPGSVEPSRRGLVAEEYAAEAAAFGSQRFHVRIEFFGPASAVVPRLRIRSWGAAELERESERFSSVTARLAGPLAAPSAVFGTPQVELAEGAEAGVKEAVEELWRRRLAFSRLLPLRDLLERSGRSWDELGWRAVDLEEGPAWGAGGALPGDVLRVGERFVILVADQGENGRLDDGDLGFDFDKGAVLRRLEEIFTGAGLVEWAPLAGNRSAASGAS
ncbi:MAG: hypothetical protein ACE5EG_00395 [Thermoanaerobaculia bacterium]